MQLKAGDVQAQRVLAFWFDGPDGGERGRVRSQWFGKDPVFDQDIRDAFGALIERALAGGCEHWALDPDTAPALVIVLDQFTRNVFRDTPAMFSGDEQALALARELVGRGADQALSPLERWFACLPFEHSESLADQERSVELFDALRAYPESAPAFEWAVSHRDVVRRFGRFPHRNAILGRESTPEERAFLETPGSRF